LVDTRSSGNAALDRAAVEMVRRASPLPKPPQPLPGSAWEFAVPTEFKAVR
jgi:periplasmic protein TonB